MSSATDEPVEPEQAERAVSENARGPEDRSRRTPSWRWSRPAIETVEERSSRRPHRSGLDSAHVHVDGGAPRAIARIE